MMADIVQILVTLFFLMESVQFTFTDYNAKRTILNKNSLELFLWMMIETVPRLAQLMAFYFFLIDIEDYFEKDPTKVGGKYRPIAFAVAISYI